MFPTDLLQRLPKIGNRERAGTKCREELEALPPLHQRCKGFHLFFFLKHFFTLYLQRWPWKHKLMNIKYTCLPLCQITNLLFFSKEIILIYFRNTQKLHLELSTQRSFFLAIHFFKTHVKIFKWHYTCFVFKKRANPHNALLLFPKTKSLSQGLIQ